MASESSSANQESRAAWKLSLYILWVCIVSSFLFAINTGMVFALSKGIENRIPSFLGLEQVIQFSLFLFPILLLYAEWYAWDVITTRRGRSL